MTLPQDPYMLLSMLNMKLRDDDFDSLEQLCDSLGADKSEIEKKLAGIGYFYNPESGSFSAE